MILSLATCHHFTEIKNIYLLNDTTELYTLSEQTA